MRLVSWLIPATLGTSLAFFALPTPVAAQQPITAPLTADTPDAPRPQLELASLEPLDTQAAQSPAAAGASSSQDAAPTPPTEMSQHDKAEQQIKEQEKQRVGGILPQFNISYRSDAVSMTRQQKISLSFHSATDPVAFGIAAIAGGYKELSSDSGFEWGAKGYGERAGAAYLDAFTGSLLGNGILPALLHQDPRYFRLGHGSATHRVLYAMMTNVMCKHDNSGRWEPNISNVGGNIAGGAISNLYYPSTSNSGLSQTFTNGFLVTAEGGLGSLFNEFWPDVSRKFLHKDPTHGLDAQVHADDLAKKKAKQAIQ
jgi:hypothetical protein